MSAAPLRPRTPADRLVVALDVPALADLDALVTMTREWVGIYKIGARLFTIEGPRAVARVLAAGARVFLDLKYHDIPNQVGTAVEAAAGLGVTWLTVHASGGRAMLDAAVEAAAGAGSGTGILAVTVLTSLDPADLAAVGASTDLEALVIRRARLAIEAGCAGVICSPREVAPLRAALGADPLLVTPGIRPAGAAVGDQKRAATPAAAVATGADYLVVGRPITTAKDPAAAVRALLAEIPV